MVFTDFDAADQYRREMFPGHKAIELVGRAELRAMLLFAQQTAEWVAFDPYRPDRKVTMLRMDLVLSWFDTA